MAITTNVAQLPDYAKPYVQDMLAQTQAWTDVNANPYQQYQGERVAGFTGLQNQAFQNAANMQPSALTDQGAGIAGLAASQALSAGQNFQPGQFGNQYQSQAPYQAQNVGNMYQGIGAFQPQNAQNQFNYSSNYDPSQDNFQNQFTAPGAYQAGQISSDKFGQPQAQEYMSPYMQSVVEQQQRDAERQADIATTQRNAEATGKGAFGGSRQAIMDAEAQRNLALQKGDIQAKGLQDAYTNAQAQFNADQARGLTAQQASEQSRQFGAGQGLQAAGMGAQYGTAAQQAAAQARQFAANQGLQAAGMGAQYGLAANQLNSQNQQFGANLGLQNQQALAQYGLAANQLNAQNQQFGYNAGLQNAQNLANYGQQAAQLAEQSRQYGAGLGLQGANTALQGASTLGTLGNQQFGQAKDISGLQFLYGTAQQQNQQALNDVNYQNFQAAQNYPKDMLAFRSNMLNGLPMQSTTQTTPDPSAMSQGIGLLGALGSYFKKGGAVADRGEPGLMALMASKYARG